MRKMFSWINRPFERLAIWLNEHAFCVGDSLKANTVHLWCIVLSFVAITLFAAIGWKGKAMEYLFMVLFLGATVLPPLFELVRSSIKKESWTPWYWFPIVIGNVFGCLLSMLVCWVFGLGSLL